VIRQTVALLVDAYRELNARKLFWIVLGISLMVAAGFACIGIGDKGVTLLWWEIPIAFVNKTALPSEAFFYKFLFYYFGFAFWLTWAAAILALISTASIIPDFVSSGAIELSLSKPIGRTRLFVTKYLTSLLFVAVQVTLFTTAAFLVIGIRGHAWVPVVFTAVPLVLAMFSYLYVISALVGLATRSTIAALLMAGLFWFSIFVVQTAEQAFLAERVTEQLAVQIIRNDLDSLEGQLAAARAKEQPRAEGDPDPNVLLADRVTDAKHRLEEAQRDEAWWRRMHAWAFATKTVLPKTAETMKLLERSLLTMGELEQFSGAAQEQGQRRFQFGQTVHGVRVSQHRIQTETEKEIRERSPLWSVGTSLLFEVCVLGLAGWIFARRDF
jgi:ABC-type transport system involved in multi-copper enzyme maturation permease subunit